MLADCYAPLEVDTSSFGRGRRDAISGGPHWYAAYTLPRHEKTVADRLLAQNIRSYLPMYSVVRKWNLRRVEVDVPLFPGYVFVQTHITEKLRILNCTGVVRLVSANSTAIPIPDEEIERLRVSLGRSRAEPYPFLAAGKQVRVKSGPFAGFQGRILRRKGRMRLVVSLDLIQSAFVLDLDASEAQLAS